MDVIDYKQLSNKRKKIYAIETEVFKFEDICSALPHPVTTPPNFQVHELLSNDKAKQPGYHTNNQQLCIENHYQACHTHMRQHSAKLPSLFMPA